MGYAVVPANGVCQVLRELGDRDLKDVIDSLREELTGAVGPTTAYVTTHPGGGDYWLTTLSCGWWVEYRRLRPDEVQEYAERYGSPTPFGGFYVADLDPISVVGP
jgi:hypothetical protein